MEVRDGEFMRAENCMSNATCGEKSTIMLFFEELDAKIGNSFNSGDPEILQWFLVKQNLVPFILCGCYAIFVKLIGPAIMKNKEPLKLRTPMIVFNLFLVVAYTITVFTVVTNLPRLGYDKFCMGTQVGNDSLAYKLVRWMWFMYILKYVEFVDTLFFILRKKNHLVSNLHVIHHTVVPLLGWILLRTETSGFQTIPVLLNGVVHIIMYTYYGLAAIGPHMKKYLWWKKYLTILQMVQFVFIVLFVVVIAPLTGCSIVKSSLLIDALGGIVFFMLFYNFYVNNFNTKEKEV
ncbi:hypothetical protein JTE90_005025 [Oedothorax gibbosus]|uniref:Elongation of very long chain fatty acids protein n=1 Tax=Oedothorax gibbosus TaxID=931172 RepID=A0AAV6VCG7_9ARAC|nr:hypothetical protein JTE90_005025 [Oedothorax gibbosus]